MLKLERIRRTDSRILERMAIHYSQPKGFVGRNLCYAIMWQETCHGAIVGGSATRFLPGRNEFFLNAGYEDFDLVNIINNLFYNVSTKGKYPLRNFTIKVLREFRLRVAEDWLKEYGDDIVGYESLVELPRTGEVYKRDGWTQVGQTIGYGCKRVAGQGSDSWSGKRVWDTVNLKPKLVFCKEI